MRKKIRLSRNTLEDAEQKTYMEWAQYQGIFPDVIVSASGGKRDEKTGAKLKVQGLQRGIPDWFIARPNEFFHGLFIELKRPKPFPSRVTPQQKKFIERLNRFGYQAQVCYGFDEAKALTEEYYKTVEFKI